MINPNIQKVNQLVNRNSPLILTAAGVTGAITTAYLAAKASFKAAEVIREEEEKPSAKEDVRDDIEIFKDRALLVWPLYIPPVVSGSLTIAAIILSNRISSRRAAAAVSAYAITERAFNEYREKVVEEIGKHKEQVIRDEIVTKEIEGSVPSQDVLIIGSGSVLCCELYTKRYFMSDMETLKKAQNDVNANIIQDVYVTLDSFYDLIGLPYTSHSSELGWDSDRLLELQLSTVLSEDGRPCLAFGYNYVKPV